LVIGRGKKKAWVSYQGIALAMPKVSVIGAPSGAEREDIEEMKNIVAVAALVEKLRSAPR